MSRYVSVIGLVCEENDPSGGIFDLERDSTDTNYVILRDLILDAISKGEDYVGCEYYLYDQSYEPMPFTGTIELELKEVCEGFIYHILFSGSSHVEEIHIEEVTE